MLPSLLGYRVLRSIGAGGMAELFLAERPGAEGARRQVVLKRILPGLARNPQFRRRFVHEARLALQLTHVNIVHVNDFREVDDTYVIEMEYVDGCDLRRLLGDGPLPLGEALHLTAQVLRGLDYAHRRLGSDGMPLEIVHRDVAPGNVLISREGEVKLADFGLARSREQLEGSDAGLRGTFAFIAPEQAEGLPVDRRSDLFSVGAVLYAALTGRSPFSADGPLATLERVRAASWEPSGAPPEVEQILGRALARDRDQRFASAAAMGEAVEDAVAKLNLRGGVDALAGRVRRVVTVEPAVVVAPREQPAASVVEPEATEEGGPASLRPVTQQLLRRSSARRRSGVAIVLIAGIAVAGGFARSRLPLSDARVARIAPVPADPVITPPPIVITPPRIELAPPAPRARTAPRAARVSPAHLTVNVDPWAYVSIDGQRRGVTPLVDLELPPGAHELAFDNPELGATRARLIKLAPGERRTLVERLAL